MIPIIEFERRSFVGQNMTSNDFDDFLISRLEGIFPKSSNSKALRLGVAIGYLNLGGHTGRISVWMTILYTWIRQISFFKCFPFSIIYSQHKFYGLRDGY